MNIRAEATQEMIKAIESAEGSAAELQTAGAALDRAFVLDGQEYSELAVANRALVNTTYALTRARVALQALLAKIG